MSLVTQQPAGDVLGWWHLEDVAQLLHLGVPRGSVLPSHKHQPLCADLLWCVFPSTPDCWSNPSAPGGCSGHSSPSPILARDSSSVHLPHSLPPRK